MSSTWQLYILFASAQLAASIGSILEIIGTTIEVDNVSVGTCNMQIVRADDAIGVTDNSSLSIGNSAITTNRFVESPSCGFYILFVASPECRTHQ